MAVANQAEYAFEAELLELRATHPKALRLYKKPSDMSTAFPESMMLEQTPEEFSKYSISERRTGINRPIVKELHETRASSTFANLESDERYETPDYISNVTTLKYLMAPNSDPMLFKAVRCPGSTAIDIRVCEASWNQDGHSTGFVMERMLSTAPEAETENHLYGLFRGSLGASKNLGNDSKITMAFTAQLDGLEYSEDREARLAREDFSFTREDHNSIVEVKSINTKSFCTKRFSPDGYLYEHKVLRQYWAQCRLTGLTSMLCGIVGLDENASHRDDLKLKEIWTYDVNRIHEMFLVAKQSTEAWKRPFPQSIFTTAEISQVRPNAAFEPWTEDECLQEFHTALTTVKNGMRASPLDDMMYFIYAKNRNNYSMTPVSRLRNDELRRINWSIKLGIRIPYRTPLASVRDSLVQILIRMASEHQNLEFLRDWVKNQSNIMLRLDTSSSYRDIVETKLMFESREQAERMFQAWNAGNPFRQLNSKASWAWHKSTLENILSDN